MEAQKPGGDASLSEQKEYDSTLASVREEAWRLVLNVLPTSFKNWHCVELMDRLLGNCQMTQPCKA
jgi:hypothetical protein